MFRAQALAIVSSASGRVSAEARVPIELLEPFSLREQP
jgi:hypothetical protein